MLPWFTGVTAGQPVVASATEASSGSGGEFIGDAHVSVEGVSVQPGLIQVRVHTGWPNPLNICVHFVG